MSKMQYGYMTFERDDAFHRKPFVESIMKLIGEWGEDIFSDDDALSVSIDSPWGTGKSAMLAMWVNYLAETPKYSRYKVVYYNAWQNNYFNDAFRPLLYELQNNDDGPQIEAFRKAGIEMAAALAEGDSDILRILASRAAGEGAGYFGSFRKINQTSEAFAKAFAKLVPSNGKLIVFVDELDRCRPDFAIATLELIRHYMSVPNVVFVFTMDLSQLTQLVRSIYGFDTDAWGYLRRFFNVSFRMPMPELTKYVENLLYKAINDSDALKEVKFAHIMSSMYTYFGLHIRDVEKITTNFIIFYSMNKIANDPNKPKSLARLGAYLYFMILKYKYPEVYKGILDKGGYHLEGDLVEGKYMLERRFCGQGEIKDLLRTMQGNRFWDEDAGPGYIAAYLFPEIVPDAKSLGQHIFEAIELFAEVG
ncbi:MAG: KAP family NTPase [Clostridiales Family XIII bacterium]|nr:KAP family NTPase [Clostridiales Family XIII bacterium]